MAHIKITIDIPDDKRFDWERAFNNWKYFFPKEDSEYGLMEKNTSCPYEWRKEVINEPIKAATFDKIVQYLIVPHDPLAYQKINDIVDKVNTNDNHLWSETERINNLDGEIRTIKARLDRLQKI
jgi:hypothetical protein